MTLCGENCRKSWGKDHNRILPVGECQIHQAHTQLYACFPTKITGMPLESASEAKIVSYSNKDPGHPWESESASNSARPQTSPTYVDMKK
jgi:hypothetical protein